MSQGSDGMGMGMYNYVPDYHREGLEATIQRQAKEIDILKRTLADNNIKIEAQQHELTRLRYELSWIKNPVTNGYY